MIDTKAVIEYTEEFLKDSENYLVDVHIASGNNVIVEIDNDNGVNIDDCATLSRYLEAKFNRDDEDFELTVTSAGLTTPFKTQRQYKKYEGKEVEVLTKDGQKFKGTLTSSNEEGFIITITKKIKRERDKRKTDVEEALTFSYDQIKYTKYLIRFK